jgi:hypothetical protein
MELIKKYDGAVFYVDILGMSALTNNQLSLTDQDYSHWLDKYKKDYTNQYLASAILTEFRQILMALYDEFKPVTIAQLSDCAFAWSKNIRDVVLFASNFMHRSIYSGLLCRAGMAFGEIIETNQKHKLRFIVGKAVTDAANLEKIAKGARVLITENFAHSLWEFDREFSKYTLPLFQPFTNPLDYSVYDEFKWYLCPALHRDVNNLNVLKFQEKLHLTKQRLKIANQIRCSPVFNWNTRSPSGLGQLKASISFISENYLLGISHNFGWDDVIPKRGFDVVENINSTIENDGDYRLIEEPQMGYT